MSQPLAARILKRSLSTPAGAAAIRKKAIQKFGAPASVNTILDDTATKEQVVQSAAGAAVKSIGTARRVFLLDPYLKPPEIEGLTYRLRALSRNEGLSAVLIATDETDDVATGATPRMFLNAREDDELSSLRPTSKKWRRQHANDDDDDDYDPYTPLDAGHTWHVAAGYDPLKLFKRGEHNNSDAVDSLFYNLGDLARTVRGKNAQDTKIPIITVPHGAVTDGGFAFLLSSYVMATDETCFRILNPSRGLSLDPVGLSYMLPRLGREFAQPAAQYPGCGLILALMGYEADMSDMMETGLATHYMESSTGVGDLEEVLAAIPPWNQQELIKRPVRYYGDPEPTVDHNGYFRNVAVANAVHCCSLYSADGDDMWDNNSSRFDPDFLFSDPSLDVDPAPEAVERSSDLVDYAATFNYIFQQEKSVTGILNAFREVAGRETVSTVENPAEEEEGIFVARDFVRRLEAQSPLALACTFRLFWLGADGRETLESCMARECKVQKKLLAMSDFENWARHQRKQLDSSSSSAGDDDDESAVEPFTAWKHKGVEEVSDDEVAEILEI